MRWHLKDQDDVDRAMELPANASLRDLFGQVRLAFPWTNPHFDMSAFTVDPPNLLLGGIHVFIRDRKTNPDPDIKMRAHGTHLSVSVPPEWVVAIPLLPSSLDIHGVVGAAVAEIKRRDWANDDKLFRQAHVDEDATFGQTVTVRQEVVLSPTGFAFWERTWRRWKFRFVNEPASGTPTGLAWTLNEVLDGAIERECVWP